MQRYIYPRNENMIVQWHSQDVQYEFRHPLQKRNQNREHITRTDKQALFSFMTTAVAALLLDHMTASLL